MNIEIIRNTLYKAYLEDFYGFCKQLGGATAEVMSEILEVSGGLVCLLLLLLPRCSYVFSLLPTCLTFSLLRSPHPSSLLGLSFLLTSPSLSSPSRHQFEADRRAINITLNSFGTELTKDDRSKLFPNFGMLFPEGTGKLAKADDAEQVRLAAEPYSVCACVLLFFL